MGYLRNTMSILPSAAFAFSCSWLALLLSPAGDPHADPADAAPGAAPQPDPPPPPAPPPPPPGPEPEGGGPHPEVPLDMVSAMPPRRPASAPPGTWPQPRPRPRRSVRRREGEEEEEAIIGRGAMLEVFERGEMTRGVEVLLVLMLEDIFVLEVAMRRLAWDCKEPRSISYAMCCDRGQKSRELLAYPLAAVPHFLAVVHAGRGSRCNFRQRRRRRRRRR